MARVVLIRVVSSIVATVSEAESMGRNIVGWESDRSTLCADCVEAHLRYGVFGMHPEGIAEDKTEGERFHPIYRGSAQDASYYVTECGECLETVSTFRGD